MNVNTSINHQESLRLTAPSKLTSMGMQSATSQNQQVPKSRHRSAKPAAELQMLGMSDPFDIDTAFDNKTSKNNQASPGRKDQRNYWHELRKDLTRLMPKTTRSNYATQLKDEAQARAKEIDETIQKLQAKRREVNTRLGNLQQAEKQGSVACDKLMLLNKAAHKFKEMCA